MNVDTTLSEAGAIEYLPIVTDPPAERDFIVPAARVALTREIARLASFRSIGELLEQAVTTLVALGTQSAMAVLHQPGRGSDNLDPDAVIYRECEVSSNLFRYTVGDYFRKRISGKMTTEMMSRGPYFGWTVNHVASGDVYCTPIFVDDIPCGALAFMLPARRPLSEPDLELLAVFALALGASVSNLQMLEATRHNAEELLVMYEIAAIMAGATLDLKVLLRQTMLMASRVLRSSASTLMLLDEQTNELIFEIPIGEGGEALQQFRLPVGQGIGGTVVQEGRPLMVNNVATDPRWSTQADHVSGFVTRSVLCVPLQVHGRTIGVLEVLNKVDGDDRPASFNRDDTALLSAIATQAAAAIENAQLYQSLVQERDRIISTEEEARRSFSRDLHDGPAQGLAAITMRIDLIKRLLPEGEALRELQTLQDLARRTNKDIRAMLSQLRPIVLETGGLIAAVQEFIASNQGDGGITYHFSPPPDLDCTSFSNSAAAAIYIIIQEAINNIKKHAQASDIWIVISEQTVRFNATHGGKLKGTSLLSNEPQRSLVVEIRDDGRGFDVDKVMGSYSVRGSYGLLNMRERAALLSGDLLIQSEIDQGTTVTVRVPFPETKI